MTENARPVLRYADGGWAEAVGGHPALDVVNTVGWRLDPARTVERLPDGAALAQWARFVGLVDGAAADRLAGGDGDRLAARLRRLRERLYRVVRPLALGDRPDPADVEALRREVAGAQQRARVEAVMPLRLSPADLADGLALQAWQLLEREDPARLRQCRAGDCGWLFLDRTRNGSRVWCSSADCGNRDRARRHYARRTSGRG